MKDIGVQKTKMDSVMRKENIALSMADVLTFNSSIFVKSYGRATLSTVAFRGTSPSHTQVTWNGMRINNPMLGMTDFSMIPSYFIDDASLLHGTSSVNDTGGGLGGSVKLSTQPADADGIGLQYIQGIGSFKTFDEFLRITYGDDHWQTSSRIVFSSSPNDYTYRNHDKKENVYDEDMNIIGQYYPKEKNKSGAFKDMHVLQEVYYNTRKGDRFGLNAWYINSNRELPMLTTDYGSDTDFENRQREHTFRGILSWDHVRSNWKVAANAGYVYTWLAYDYRRDVGNGNMQVMTRSRSKVNTFYGKVDGEYYLGEKWLLTANLSAHQHFVTSADKNIIRQDGNQAIVGYQKGRMELSGSVSAKWRPNDRVGVSAVVREDVYGRNSSPIIPALFVDGVLSERGNVMAKASVSRNYRFPSLNDLYFQPGGNPDLRPEKGWSYDVGISFKAIDSKKVTLTGEATWFDSYIDDWIFWYPKAMGYYTPANVKEVHSYGIESRLSLEWRPSNDWSVVLNGTYAWTPSKNVGEPFSSADRSVGKQLPYVPLHSASAGLRVAWRQWSLDYKWCSYSERYTLSSNGSTITGTLDGYALSNLSLGRSFTFRWCDLSLKGSINNLFDKEYMAVLAHPMPGINYEFFIGITPRWGKKN